MWTSLSLASSSSAVGLISGSCPSARVFAPRFLQTPPRDDALALRYHFSPSGCEEDLHLQAVIHERRTLKKNRTRLSCAVLNANSSYRLWASNVSVVEVVLC